jgi:hypothetical protein
VHRQSVRCGEQTSFASFGNRTLIPQFKARSLGVMLTKLFGIKGEKRGHERKERLEKHIEIVFHSSQSVLIMKVTLQSK